MTLFNLSQTNFQMHLLIYVYENLRLAMYTHGMHGAWLLLDAILLKTALSA